MFYKIRSLSASDNISAASRRICQLAFAIGGFAIGTAEFVIMACFPERAKTMDVSEPMAGHFISAYAIGVVIGAPVTAALATFLIGTTFASQPFIQTRIMGCFCQSADFGDRLAAFFL